MSNYKQTAQTILKKTGLYTNPVDGIFGKNSQVASREYYDFPKEWTGDRLAIGTIQVYATRNNIKIGTIDGFWGNNTQSGYTEVVELLGVKALKPVEVDQNIIVKPTYNNWPKQDYNSMVKFYGKVGENQTSLVLPYEMKLAWDLDTKVSKITCHEKVHDSLKRIFQKTLDHYGLETVQELRLDRFGGGLNVRKMRGGSAWSIHSWGAAIDLDPDRNQLKWGRDKAFFARPEYEPFWKIVESEGATSLGRARNIDFMHFQFASL
jgi:hypothetical protein